MSSSPNISFVLHDVARLLRKRFEQHSRTTRAQSQVVTWLPNLTRQPHRLLEIRRGSSRKRRDEAFAGASPETRQHPLQTPNLIKSNLLAARTQPAGDREKAHG